MADDIQDTPKKNDSQNISWVTEMMHRIDDRSFFQIGLSRVLKVSAAVIGGLFIIFGALNALKILTHQHLSGAEGLGGFTAWLMLVVATAYGMQLVWKRANQILADDTHTITELGIHCGKVYAEIFALLLVTALAGFAVCLIIAGGGAQSTLMVMFGHGPTETSTSVFDLAQLSQSEVFPRIVGLVVLPIALIFGFVALFILYFLIDVLRALYARPMVAAIVFGVILLATRMAQTAL